MSLPNEVHAIVQRCAAGGEEYLYVATVEEMPGIQCSAPGQQEVLAELRKLVESIQSRSGGPGVEIVEPPFIGYDWIQYSSRGQLVDRIEHNFALGAPGVGVQGKELLV